MLRFLAQRLSAVVSSSMDQLRHWHFHFWIGNWTTTQNYTLPHTCQTRSTSISSTALRAKDKRAVAFGQFLAAVLLFFQLNIIIIIMTWCYRESHQAQYWGDDHYCTCFTSNDHNMHFQVNLKKLKCQNATHLRAQWLQSFVPLPLA